MQLTVKGKQMDVGDALRAHVQKDLDHLAEKYFSRAVEATVVFSHEAHMFKADISINAGHDMVLQGSAEASDAYPAFDMAADKIAKRIHRHKERLRDHQQRGTAGSEREAVKAARQYILEGQAEKEHPEPLVIAEMQARVETLTVGEAVMRLDLGDMPALLFHNKAHGGLNMVYRRADGNIGWVDPQGNDKVSL